MQFSRFSFSAFAGATAAATLLFVPAAVPQTASAQVVAPNGLTAVEGNTGLSTPNNTNPRVYQTQIAASQLTAFSIGSQISGISFRLDAPYGGPTTDLSFASYQVTLSQAANTIGNFSTTFADNIGANAALVYDNALTFTAASYGNASNGTGPKPFGPTINFSSGYTYQGGDLVITLRHSGNGSGQFIYLDSTFDPAQGFGTTIVGQYSDISQDATTANNADSAAVIRLNPGIAAVGAPEPATLPLVGMGLTAGVGMVGGVRSRKAKKQP